MTVDSQRTLCSGSNRVFPIKPAYQGSPARNDHYGTFYHGLLTHLLAGLLRVFDFHHEVAGVVPVAVFTTPYFSLGHFAHGYGQG